jgi:DNA invertase Pin-like site-specific DNA recombinase
MLRIGYIGLSDSDRAVGTAALRAKGCQVVREETPAPADLRVLSSILDFIGPGDELMVGRLDQLAPNSRGVLEVMERLELRGATLRILEPDLCSAGEGGRALRAALEAVAMVEPAVAAPRRGSAAAHEIRALQRAGVGPVEIARRLGVSRMTVWRKLRALEA